MCQYQTSNAHGREHREAKTPPAPRQWCWIGDFNEQSARRQMTIKCKKGWWLIQLLPPYFKLFLHQSQASISFSCIHTRTHFPSKVVGIIIIIAVDIISPRREKNKIKKGTFWSHQHFHGFSLSTHFFHYRLALVFLSSF